MKPFVYVGVYVIACSVDGKDIVKSSHGGIQNKYIYMHRGRLEDKNRLKVSRRMVVVVAQQRRRCGKLRHDGSRMK